MISFVRGKVVEKFGVSVVVDVSGVGYEVLTTTDEWAKASPREEVRFYTYHHVREQAEELFGFSTLAGKRLFELLISVQGVGPKAALAILDLAENEAVRSAIASRDVAFVAGASGVGKKTAERVILDLAEKVGIAGTVLASGDDEALDALVALGFSLADASAALQKVDKNLPAGERVKQALKEGR